MILTLIKIEGLDEAFNWAESELDDFQEKLAEQIPIEARRIIDESTPGGKTYRRKVITNRATKGLLQLGLKRRGKTRVVTGYEFHKASAKGQPPAKDTENLYKNIRVRKTAKGHYRISFVPYAGILEFHLDRPFILPAIEAAVKKVLNV